MKKLTALLIASLMFGSDSSATPTTTPSQHKPITLDSNFLQFVDGQPFGINASVFGCLLKIRFNMKRFLYGNGSHERLTLFDGDYYTIQDIARIEVKNQKDYRIKLNKKHDYSPQEWHTIENEYNTIQEKLAASLIDAKKSFIDFIMPFFENVRGIKKQMLPLVEESCTKHKRSSSLLPGCIMSPDNKETDFFEKRVASFKQLGLISLDIIHFTTDMINSCPKAREQFEKLRLEKEEEYQHSILDSVTT